MREVRNALDKSDTCHPAPNMLCHLGIRLLDRRGGRGMRYGRLFHWVFEWDPPTGFSCDRINYGPIDVTASTWIVPGTILEEEPYSDEEDNEL
jgi:hypothetical protein